MIMTGRNHCNMAIDRPGWFPPRECTLGACSRNETSNIDFWSRNRINHNANTIMTIPQHAQRNQIMEIIAKHIRFTKNCYVDQF